MKKKNLKSLKLNKKSISSLENTKKVYGGAAGIGEEDGSSYFSCIGGICVVETEITCPTWVLCDWTKVAGGCSF